jgi:hypothetical protein
MFRILSDKKLREIRREERHIGITLGSQLAQSGQTGKGFIYGCKGIEVEKQPNKLLNEIDNILENKDF